MFLFLQEYQRQRYEAASTIFGPHTLLAYQQQYRLLTQKMLVVSWEGRGARSVSARAVVIFRYWLAIFI